MPNVFFLQFKARATEAKPTLKKVKCGAAPLPSEAADSADRPIDCRTTLTLTWPPRTPGNSNATSEEIREKGVIHHSSERKKIIYFQLAQGSAREKL